MNRYDIIQKGIDELDKGKKCPLLPHIVTKEHIIKTFFTELLSDGTFDYAIPSNWSDHVNEVTGKNTWLFVWHYPKDKYIFGYPFPLSRDAKNTLKEYTEKTGYTYPEPSE